MSTSSPKAINTIKCLSNDPNFMDFFDNSIRYGSVEFNRIYSDEILEKYVECIENSNYSGKVKNKNLRKTIKKYIKNNTLRYLFLLYVYNKAFSKDKEYFIVQALNHLSSPSVANAPECICSNKDDDTLLGDAVIKDLPLKDLYLLPSGRCIKIEDLMMHLETSQNKFLDPTSPFGVKDKLWENGWDLQRMLDTIIDYSSLQEPEMHARGKKIKNDFDIVLKDYINKVSDELKTLLEETYFLFYFAEAKNKQQVEKMLKKYKFPDLEKYDQDKVDKLFSSSSYSWQDAYNDDISQFRSLLGFKIGYKILEEIPPEEKEAILFIGEWAGMAREGWDALTSGKLCTKTYGSFVHRMSDILKGNI